MSTSKRIKTNDEISKIRQMYDTIYQQNSSYRQSLLVSPHCSKYQRNSPKANSTDKSLSDYIKPFDRQAIQRTQAKQKPIIRQNNQTRQHLSEGLTQDRNLQSLSDLVFSLRQQITKKNKRILHLEQALTRVSNKNLVTTVDSCRIQSPQRYSCRDFSPLKENNSGKNSRNSLLNTNLREVQAQYRKQMVFLTQNNQQLYQQIHKFRQQNKKLKKFMNQALQYTQQIQLTLKKTKIMNTQLLKQKQQMMANYKEQIKLFIKMKKLYQENHPDKIVCECKCHKDKNKNNIKN